jgi:hypothetical protein
VYKFKNDSCDVSRMYEEKINKTNLRRAFGYAIHERAGTLLQ